MKALFVCAGVVSLERQLILQLSWERNVYPLVNYGSLALQSETRKLTVPCGANSNQIPQEACAVFHLSTVHHKMLYHDEEVGLWICMMLAY